MTAAKPVRENGNSRGGKELALLTLGALGVVFGDIGTSPLYAMRECFHGAHGLVVSPENVLGVLSLIFWAMVLVISVEYMTFVTRADNRGEGGILALMVLAVSRASKSERKSAFIFISMGLFGAALLYGDGMITPAISVLSAVEGLRIATPVFSDYVVPITAIILLTLFSFQRYGTARIGSVLGPVVLTWFTCIGLLGLRGIINAPGVLAAVNPLHGLQFFLHNGGLAFFILGSVFLVVTGAEALYADMGHFGRRPIQLGWFVVALPALALNYFGQGALLLTDAGAVDNPFYRLAPSWALYPTVAIATLATVIASQAVISGAFSITRQAVQLGYLPRMSIVHTSSEEIGQIYVPTVNRFLMIATLGLVLGFQSSSNLAAAYGVAVTTTMVITTLLLNIVARRLWGWKWYWAALFSSPFLIINLSFFGAALLKITHGGWFPLLVGAVVFTVMTTWRKGRQILGERLQAEAMPLDVFLKSLAIDPPLRVPGTAIVMAGNPTGTPLVLLHNLKFNRVLHERVIMLTITYEEESHIPRKERIKLEEVGPGIYRLIAYYGFMESPDVPAVLRQCKDFGIDIDPKRVVFFLSRERLIAARSKGMSMWRGRLFAFLSRNAQGATAFFNIPPAQVIELGVQVEL